MVWLLLAAAVLAVSFAVYRIAFYSPRGKQNDPHQIAELTGVEPYRETIHAMVDELLALPFERVSIRSFDGLTLSGRYYHQKDGAPLDICFHGYRGLPTRDFCGGVKICLNAGHNVLLIEERAHAGSQGHTITFGLRERLDCQRWAEYAAERFGPEVRILLHGISMGAATVLMASELPLPENVRGIAADCPYNSPKAILQKVCRDMGYPPRLVWPFLWLGALLFGGFVLRDVRADEAVTRSRVPILLIHGDADDFVPWEMSQKIARAGGDKVSFHTFPGAGHGLSYMTDPERYARLLTGFFEKTLGT